MSLTSGANANKNVFTDTYNATAPLSGTPLPNVELGEPSFTDRTAQAVDDIIESICLEFSREAKTLRGQLDEFEQMLVTKAAKTRGDMLAFVDLVKAGHGLTLQITSRLGDMRADMHRMTENP